MKRIKRCSTLIAILAIILLSIATSAILVSCRGNLCANDEALDPEVAKIIKDGPSAESYPDGDMIWLLDETECEIFDDGSRKETTRQVIKILTESGKDYADCEIGFNLTLEKVTLLHARTITPDGKIIPLKENAMQITTPYSDYPEYSDYRVLTFSLPGVEVGSIIDYEYTDEVKPFIQGTCLTPFYFQAFDPSLRARYKIVAPASMKINYYFRNPLKATDGSPTISTKGDKKTYLWEYSHIPQIFYEDFMPPIEESVANVMVTSMDSWEEFFSWWRNEIKDKAEPNEEIKAKVKELTKGLSSFDEKMAAIFDYVKREIRYVSISMGQSGYVPVTAQEVLANKYGDCKDKSTLLISMLKTAAINAYYVLIPTTDMGDLIPGFPHYAQFDHCIVAVEKGDGYHYLDPGARSYTYDYLPAMDQNRNVVVFKGATPVFTKTPILEAEKNTMLARVNMDLKPDGTIRANVVFDWEGAHEASLRRKFMDIGPKEEKQAIQDILNDISPEASLVDYSHSDPYDFKKKFMANVTFDAHAYCEQAGDLLIFLLPTDVGAYSVPEMEERRYPICYRLLDNDVVEVECNVPEGYDIYHLPERVDLETPHIKFHSGYSAEKNKIIYHAQLMDNTLKIPAAEYKDYRKACQMMNKTLERHLIFRKKQA